MKEQAHVVLAAVNSKSSHSNPTLFHFKNHLAENSDCKVTLLELTINESWRDALEKLTDTNGHYFLFSVYIWNRSWLERLLPLLKKLAPESRIILGGPEITWNRSYWEEMDWTDTLVIGQAEGFMEKLFDFREKVFISPPTPIGQIGFPYGDEDREVLEGRLVYYEASRGCLFNCSYCLSACEQGKPEYRELETVKGHVEKLIALKPKIVKMVDRTFNSDRDFARALWQYLIDRKSPVPFHFELHPLFLEEEDFAILEKAPPGLFFFEVGIQSTDREVLTAVNRPWHRPAERMNIERLCRMKNIHTHLDQIVALPMDTPEKAVRSFNEIISHRPDDFQLGFLKILPGTPLGTGEKSSGMIRTEFPPYEVVETPWFPMAGMREFYRTEADLNRYYNSGNFPETLAELMVLFPSPWIFFRELSRYSPENRVTKQWPELAKSLLLLGEGEIEGGRDYLMDLLRLDWCPHASGQAYPPLLRREEDGEINVIRRNGYPLFKKMIEGFSNRDYKRSILYVPSSQGMKDRRKEMTLFYRREGAPTEPYGLNFIPIS